MYENFGKVCEGSEAIARALRFFAFDSDGCLFPNDVWEGMAVGDSALKPKIRSYYDGQGMSLLRALGIRLCVITNEQGSNAAAVRGALDKWNSLPSCKNELWHPIELFEGCGGPRKLETLDRWLKKHGGSCGECGAMGDDLVDVAMLRAVAFAAAPSSGEEAVRKLCHFVSKRPGGAGAVRDLANFLVAVHKKDPLELPFE
ncbi:MAG TPA: hypothetical protein VMT80_01115 [Candidatus Paceibacterota bacterium]|nr:hypothetical protein [Candidatus Paceibacterota bacterium]